MSSGIVPLSCDEDCSSCALALLCWERLDCGGWEEREGAAVPRGAKALGGFLQQKPGQVRQETAPRGPAFLVPLPLVFSLPCFLHCDRFRFLTTLLGSTRTPASNTDLSVTQWPTAPSALSSSPSSPSSLVRGCKVGKWGMFPFPTAHVGSWGSPMRCLGPGCSSPSPPCWTCCL